MKLILLILVGLLAMNTTQANNGKNSFHYDHIVCTDEIFDFCLEMKFHCNGNEITKFAILKEESTKCSFKGDNIFVSSKNCLNGIDKENWDLEVYSNM